jgi:hypothetical protein
MTTNQEWLNIMKHYYSGTLAARPKKRMKVKREAHFFNDQMKGGIGK